MGWACAAWHTLHRIVGDFLHGQHLEHAMSLLQLQLRAGLERHLNRRMHARHWRPAF